MKITLLALLVTTISTQTFAEGYGSSTGSGVLRDTSRREPTSTTSPGTSTTESGMVEDITTTTQSATTRDPAMGTETTTRKSTVTTTGRCITYEGREYGQGEAGYNECLRNSTAVEKTKKSMRNKK